MSLDNDKDVVLSREHTKRVEAECKFKIHELNIKYQLQCLKFQTSSLELNVHSARVKIEQGHDVEFENQDKNEGETRSVSTLHDEEINELFDERDATISLVDPHHENLTLFWQERIEHVQGKNTSIVGLHDMFTDWMENRGGNGKLDALTRKDFSNCLIKYGYAVTKMHCCFPRKGLQFGVANCKPIV